MVVNGIDPPPAVVLTWPTPNYIDPPTRGCAPIVGIIFLSVLSVAVVSARIWARFFMSRTAGLDDWTMMAAMVRRARSRQVIPGNADHLLGSFDRDSHHYVLWYV